MKTRIAFVLAAALIAPAVAGDKSDAANKEFAKLQGTWTFVSMEQDGQPAPKTDPMPIITFEKDRFTVKVGDMVVQAGTQTLDPSKKPHAVDAKVTEGEGKGNTMLGIYELDGDSLKACFDTTGKKRPTEFKTAAGGSGQMLVVMKRKK